MRLSRLLPALAALALFASAPLADAAKPTNHAAAKSTAKKSEAKKTEAKKTTSKKTASKKTATKSRASGKTSKLTASAKAREEAARTEAALRDKTDDFVSLIKTGQQNLNDAQIAWKAKHPDIACQRARSARTQFGKARGTLDDMVKTAQDGKGDVAPLKALYPKTDELDDTTRKLINMTCN